MKKIYLLSIIALAFFGTQSMAQEVVNSLESKTPHICDGNLDEWETPLRLKENNLQYDFSNDAENIYVAVKSMDRPNNIKMTRGGLKVWFNVSGKKKETCSIALLSAKPTENGKRPFEKGERPSREKMEQLFKEEKKEIHTQGFSTIADGIYPKDSAQGIKAGATFDKDGYVVYEFALPIHLLKDKDGKSLDTEKAIAIEIEIAALKMPNFGGGGMPGGGMPGGGMPQMGGAPGGMPGGGMPQMGGDFEKMTTTDHIWNKVKINISKK